MNYYYLLVPLLLSIVIIILYIQNKKKKEVVERLVFEKHKLETLRKDEIKNYFKEEWVREENELDNRIRLKREAVNSESAKLESEFKFKERDFVNELSKLQVQLNEKEARYREVNQDLDLYKQGKMKEIDGTAAEYEEHKRILVAQSIDKYRDLLIDQANKAVCVLTTNIDFTNKELEKIQAELEVERSKRAVINEEIRRQREVEEQQDFYKIQFSDEDRNDVEILRSVAPRLRHPEAINKVIWSAYYQKPLAELRKRLLPNGDKSGIYKITRLKTGEIYIGSTTSFDTRFVNHYKTALGVGTLASSQLHRMMRKDGPEHFTVEILEEDIPKDKLKEKESYYIDFYDSKNYGLNTIRGEQNK